LSRMTIMTSSKPANSTLTNALRANLQRRKAQMSERGKLEDAQIPVDEGVRYSGFIVRDKPQVDEAV
jgi:hypothetical protein